MRLRRSAFPLLLLALGGAPSAPAQRPGVTLFEGSYRTGESETFYRDEPDLDDTRFGSRRSRSVGVARGCEVTLFEYRNYRGRSLTLSESDNDLGNTSLGRDSVSSLRVRCPGGGGGEGWAEPYPVLRDGVTLFRDRRLQGPSQTFTRDVADLDDTPLGAGRASSIHVSRGCVAVLYERTGFRGRSVTLSETDNDLGNTAVGSRGVASMQVRCADAPPGPDAGPHQAFDGRHGATLFRDRSLGGPWQTFVRDVPDLRGTPIGAGTASSIALRGGCTATLYEQTGYRGRSTAFREDDRNLGNTEVGEDRASSMRVECPGGHGGGRPPGSIDRPEAAPQGVTLYRDRSLRGPSETFTRDVPDLRATSIGAGTASSIGVPSGCVATLFAEPNYRGSSTEFRDADNNLANTPVGEDRAASIRVDCRR